MILADFSLLRRRRDLRLLVVGYTVSLFGTMFTQVALAVQVYDLTGSTLAVGLLGAAEFIPIVALALVGGALADAFDRRKLICGAELAAAFVSAALLVNALLPAPAAVGALRRGGAVRRRDRGAAPAAGRAAAAAGRARRAQGGERDQLVAGERRDDRRAGARGRADRRHAA